MFTKQPGILIKISTVSNFNKEKKKKEEVYFL